MGISVRQAQTNFTRGEYQPEMFGRYDHYKNGAQQLKNFAPLVQGGARTRPGLRYIDEVPQSPAIIQDFVFNDDQRYAFVFSNNQVDIYQAPTWSKVATLSSAPWTSSQLVRLAFTHFGDTLLLFHPDMETQVIARTGATTFTRTAFAFEENSAGFPKYQPYYKYAASDMTLTPSATSGSGVTLTLSSPGAWTSDHVGSIVRYKEKEIEITGYTSATVATGTVRETLPATTADADWDEAVFSDARGWAAHGEFHNSRLWLFACKSRPTGRWFSKVGAFYNFDLGTQQDNEASWEAVNSSGLAGLRFGVSTRHMVMFSDNGVFLQPETQARPITPDNADSIKQSEVGCDYLKPVVYDGGIIFCHKEGRAVSEMRYNDVDQAYTPNPLTHTAGHLINQPVAMAALHDSPNRQEKYCLLCNGDGNLSVMHSNEKESILGWTPWVTQGTFESVGAVGKDVLCLIEREIDGSTVLSLEIFDDDAAALDCSKKATSGTATKSFSGFSHLANETVNVVSNGHSLGQTTVDGSGNITLDDLDPEVTEIEAGFAYQQKLQPMPAVYDLRDGESRGTVMGLVRCMLEVDRADAFIVNGTGVELAFSGDDYTESPPTKTGIVEIYSLGYDKDAAPLIVVNDPQKITILGMIREVEVNS